MKRLSDFIIENTSHFLVNKKSADINYAPKNMAELLKIIKDRIKSEGWECDLNDIDVSGISDFNHLFSGVNGLDKFNGDISQWDMSNAVNTRYMFSGSDFNGDISNWDMSKVASCGLMFRNSNFNGDISKWNMPKCINAYGMFKGSDFAQDIGGRLGMTYEAVTSSMFDDTPNEKQNSAYFK